MTQWYVFLYLLGVLVGLLTIEPFLGFVDRVRLARYDRKQRKRVRAEQLLREANYRRVLEHDALVFRRSVSDAEVQILRDELAATGVLIERRYLRQR